MNLVCNTNLTTASVMGRCECRRDMRWNGEAGECQIYMNVDCSSITYDTPVSEAVMTAVEKAKQDMADAAGCPQPNYFCSDGESCIPSGRVCDGVADCPQTETGPGGEEEGECGSGGGPIPQEGGLATTPTTTTNTTVNTVQTGRDTEFLNRTQSKEESLSTSLLTRLDPTKVTPEELTEAFCRDIDAFSFEFQNTTTPPVVTTPPPPPPDERPSLLCTKVPSHLCAVAYDSSTCSGGWRLPLPEGQIRFRFWSSWNRYRNDMDTIGVRAGCTFSGHSDSDFNGNSVVVRAQGWDRWVVFERVPQYAHMAEDIESVSCVCRG